MFKNRCKQTPRLLHFVFFYQKSVRFLFKVVYLLKDIVQTKLLATAVNKLQKSFFSQILSDLSVRNRKDIKFFKRLKFWKEVPRRKVVTRLFLDSNEFRPFHKWKGGTPTSNELRIWSFLKKPDFPLIPSSAFNHSPDTSRLTSNFLQKKKLNRLRSSSALTKL